MRDDGERLEDILEAIEKIEKYTAKGHEIFFKDELIQVWIVHHIQIIGEAANSLSQSLIERYKGTPWVDVVSMRNVLVHQYFGIDLEEVWDTATIDVPNLKKQVEAILENLEESK